MKKIIKIVVLSLALIVLVFGGLYFYSGIKAIKNTENKWLVDYRSTKRTNDSQVAGAETNLTQSISTESIQPAGSTNPKSTTKSSNSQQTSQTTTQPSPTPPSPSCNQAQKATLVNIYNTHVAEAARERDQIRNDALNQYLAEVEDIKQRYNDIWDPIERMRLITEAMERAGKTLDDARNWADWRYNGFVAASTNWLNAALRSINC
jgi:hypothetical protein